MRCYFIHTKWISSPRFEVAMAFGSLHGMRYSYIYWRPISMCGKCAYWEFCDEAIYLFNGYLNGTKIQLNELK